MLDSLTISLLGPFQVTQGQQIIDTFETAKVRALLAYLAIEGTRPLEQSHLAGLLWPDVLESSARVNLRSALANLRKVIGDTGVAHDSADIPPFILATQ